MKRKSIRMSLAIVIVFTLIFTPVSGGLGQAVLALLPETEMSDSGGNELTLAGLTSVGGFSTAPDGGWTVAHAMQPPSLLTQADYQQIYDEAQGLLDVGLTFRKTEIQTPAPSGDGFVYPITDPLQNYKDFNDGELFFGFCSDYDQIDGQGNCPEADDIRNQMIRARQFFGVLSLADPFNTEIESSDGEIRNVREVGRERVLEATRELANIHLIFGNEFLVDALDYRFSGATTNADEIIAQELNQLTLAVQQFALAVDVFTHALNADFGGPNKTYIADYFSEREFELFGIASERMVQVLDEAALRHRQLGEDDETLELFRQAATTQYIQFLALAQKAEALGIDFLDNGAWHLAYNLNQLHAEADLIHDGLNPYGFAEDFIPLHDYNTLTTFTGQLLQDATNDEEDARTAQREFDHNATALNSELQNLRTAYDAQLLEMCGESDDDFLTCEEGLMEQNYHAMVLAAQQIQLADQRLAQIPEKIQIEQDRAGQVIEVTLEQGEALSAIAYAIGVRNSYKETTSIVNATSQEWYFKIGVSASIGIGFGRSDSGGFFGVSAEAGYRHSRSITHSFTRLWDPAQEELGRLNGLRDVQSAVTQAQITGANSEAAIRNLLLQQADLMIELDMAYERWNQLSAEHNHLVEKYHNMLNLRVRAQENLLDSYLNNPAYRVLRDSLTVEAARSHGLAAQFAYLTAKGLEYEFLTPVPFIDDIFKARTADDVDNFLLELEQWRLALGEPGYLNRFPYTISVAEDLLGFSDENLDPDGNMTPSERRQLRYDLFQQFLQQHLDADTLEFPLTTSILDNNIFSQNIWNNRLTGINLPNNVPNTQGLALNILTRQFGDVGTPEVILIHDGAASYRSATGEISEYDPGRTRLFGYPLPAGFQNESTSALILASVNGNQQGTPTSALYNRSVAASNWTLRLDLTSPFNDNLDITQIEDIKIQLDSTGIALPNFAPESVQEESERLIETFEEAKRKGVEAK